MSTALNLSSLEIQHLLYYIYIIIIIIIMDLKGPGDHFQKYLTILAGQFIRAESCT